MASIMANAFSTKRAFEYSDSAIQVAPEVAVKLRSATRRAPSFSSQLACRRARTWRRGTRRACERQRPLRRFSRCQLFWRGVPSETFSRKNSVEIKSANRFRAQNSPPAAPVGRFILLEKKRFLVKKKLSFSPCQCVTSTTLISGQDRGYLAGFRGFHSMETATRGSTCTNCTLLVDRITAPMRLISILQVEEEGARRDSDAIGRRPAKLPARARRVPRTCRRQISLPATHVDALRAAPMATPAADSWALPPTRGRSSRKGSVLRTVEMPEPDGTGGLGGGAGNRNEGGDVS